jgi:predicted HTH transcriptional regulator
MKFQYRNAGYGFFAEFNYERQKISLEEKSSEKSSEVFSLIAGEPHITIASIARQLNISTRMVEKYLAKLTSEGKVVRVKGRKTGHWEITDKTGKTD